jgi:hypothetical protein
MPASRPEAKAAKSRRATGRTRSFSEENKEQARSCAYVPAMRGIVRYAHSEYKYWQNLP